MNTKLLVALAVLAVTFQLVSTATKKVICYHGTWSYSRPGNGQFNISNVPADLCTHYIYAFVGLDPSNYTVKILDEPFDIDQNGFANAVALKKINPRLKVLIAIGGWNEGSITYSKMAADADLRTRFIASAHEFVIKYGFDGFDIDWEYPARRDSTNVNDKENFAILLQEWYKLFHGSKLLLTAAVSALPSTVDISYHVPSLNKYLDSINVMTYDLSGAWDNFAGFNSPLYSAAKDAGTIFEFLSVNASIYGWIQRGASPRKLAIGVPFYGRTNILLNASNPKPGDATAATGGKAGPYTGEAGILSYLEIVEEFINAGGWKQEWNDEQKVPYAYKNTTWLSFENVQSIKLKAKYVKSQRLGGVSIWSIDSDDRPGTSGTTFPLLKAINDVLGRSQAH